MLDHEFGLMTERLGGGQREDTCLFSFADTVAARNYAGTNECHGWIGLRFQAKPGGEPNEILLHVNMRDNSNQLQQDAVGLVGINLIHAAYHSRDSICGFLDALFEGLTMERLEVDFMNVSGPIWGEVDRKEVAVSLVRRSMAPAVVLDEEGRLVPPTEVIRKRPVLVERCSLVTLSGHEGRMLTRAKEHLPKEAGSLEREPLTLIEVSTTSKRNPEEAPDTDYVRRVAGLQPMGHKILVTRLDQGKDLTTYLRRYSREPFRFVGAIEDVVPMLRDTYYGGVHGGLLEGVGRLFSDNVKLYIHPTTTTAFRKHLEDWDIEEEFVSVLAETESVSAGDLQFKAPLDLFYRYLLEVGWIIPLAGLQPNES